MSAQNDFALTIDIAAGLLVQVLCEARSAGHRPLPQPHRRLLSQAIRHLEQAQDDLWKARNDPWSQQQQNKPRQMALL